ncbi:hypothetical protein ACLFKX_08455 [Enterobacter hormaechei]
MTVPVQHPMYIDGQFAAWRGDPSIDVIDPASGRGHFPYSRRQRRGRPQGH